MAGQREEEGGGGHFVSSWPPPLPPPPLQMVKAQGSMLARVPQRGRYATFRYLPPELDKTVTAARERQRAKEDDERSRQRAIAESTGTKWDAASFESRWAWVGRRGMVQEVGTRR